MYEAVVGRVRLNSSSPGIVVTPLALDEFNGPRGDFYKICLRNVRLVDQERLMRLPTLLNS